MLFDAGDVTIAVIEHIEADVALAVVGIDVDLDVVAMVLHDVVATNVDAVVAGGFLDGALDGVGAGLVITHNLSSFGVMEDAVFSIHYYKYALTDFIQKIF